MSPETTVETPSELKIKRVKITASPENISPARGKTFTEPNRSPRLPQGKPLPGLPTTPRSTAEKIFKFWNGLSPEDVARTVLYVYRKWPVIDRTKVGGPEAEKNIGKYHAPFELEEIKKIFGSGSYSFRLNENEFYRKTVLQTPTDSPYIIRDDDYPPVVDLRELDLSDPLNASFIQKLRGRGIALPGDEDKDMAAGNAAMETMAQTIKDLSTQAVTAAQRPPQITAVPIRSDTAEQAAQKGANEMLVETCKTAISIVKESATSNQHAANPLEMVEAVTKIAERISPKPDSSGAALIKEVLESNRVMNERISDMQNKQIDDLRTELRSSRRESEASVTPPKSFIEQIREMKDSTDLLKDLTGNGEESGRSGKTTVMDLMPVLIPAGLTFLGQIASMVHNYAVAKGATQAMAPPALPLTPEQQQMAQNAGMLQNIEQHQQQPQQPQGPQPVINPLYAMFVRQHPMLEVLKKPLLDFFSDPTLQYPGAEFASFFIQLHGRLDYERLCGVGADMIGQLLASYPPIWNEIGGLPRQAEDSKFPIKVEQFITDFCNHDAIREAQDVAAEDEAVSEGPRKVRL